MQGLYSRFKKFVEQKQLIPNSASLVVGVSGGVDSVTLLELLLRYKREKRTIGKFRVAHFNHSTRHGKSDLDENLVKTICENKNLPLESQKANIPKIAQSSHKSFEMVAREERYKFFNSITGKNELIATGHTLDDQVETILLRFIRGTGLNGISGITPKYKNRIKPLLFAQKQTLYNWADREGLRYREDHTNYENHCLRNVVRNKLIPTIRKDINPGYRKSIHHLSQIAQETNNYLEKKANNLAPELIIDHSSWFYALNFEKLKSLHTVEIKYILLEICRRIKEHTTVGYDQFNQFMDQLHRKNEGQILKLDSDIWTNFDRNQVIIYNKDQQNWKSAKIIPGEKLDSETFEIITEKLDKSKVDFQKDSNIEYLDLAKIEGNLIIRHWKEGDVFNPLGLQHHKKLSDYFIDNKIPKYKKHHIPILVNKGKILWICGERLSEKFKITSTTKDILKLKYIQK